MKTTIEISDNLAKTAKEHARRQSTTLRALVERGLRMAIDENAKDEEFRLRDASVSGNGLQEPYRDAGWAEIRDSIYRGRGS